MATPSQTNFGHQSPQSSLPPLSQKQINTGTWGAGVDVWVTGTAAQAAGNWSYVVTQGSCVVTSSSSESSTLPVSYVIL